jgi:hypothetical protein
MRPINGDGVTLVPNATLRYTAQFDDSYRETGSLANQTVGARTGQAVDGRMMLDAKLDSVPLFQDNTVQPSFRVGVQGQTLVGSRSVDVTTLGSNLSFNPKGGDNTLDGILGVNFTQDSTTGGPQFYLDAEGNLGLNKGGADKNKGIVGRLGARWKW